MVFLQPASTESVFVFSTEDGSDAIVLDIKGVYALIDGGSEPLGFLDCLRAPTAAIVSTASPSGLTNAIKLNEQADSLVAVLGNLPSPAALKDAVAAEPLRQLYKTLSVPPIATQLKGAKPEPMVIHKNLSSGTLSVYTLAGDAKDAEAVAKAYQSGSSESIEAAAAAGSSVLLIVWQPVREDAPIKRILHLGSAPLPRIQQALERARALPFLQSATASAAFLKAKPAASAAKPPARAAPTSAAPKPAAARVAPATRPAAPAARPAPAARAAPTSAAAPKPPAASRASLPARPASSTAPKSAAPTATSAARPARASAAAAPRPTPAARAPRASAAGGGAKEEVAKKTIVGRTAAAPSSARGSASSTPNGLASRTPSKATGPPSVSASPAAPVAATAAVAAVAATAVVASAAAAEATPPVSPTVQQQSEEQQETAAPAVAAPSISVSIEEGEKVTTPGGLPVPASPTIIPATPQPPMSPEPEDHKEQEKEEEPVHETTPEPAAPEAVDAADAVHVVEEQPQHPVSPTLPSAPAAETTETTEEELPAVPSAPLEPAASVDEPECVKELVDEEPLPTPPVPAHEEPELPKEDENQEDPYKAVEPVVEPEPTPISSPVEPEPTPTPVAVPVDPTPVGDLLGDFDEPVQPQLPGDDGLLDSLEEPMKKMQISMDTDKLAEELGLTGGEHTAPASTGDVSLLDFTQESILDSDLDTTQTTVIESAHELDGHLSPTKEETAEEIQRKLSMQAEESLLTAAADPFIAGLASTVVEAATIDGAKSTLESLIGNSKGVESPTGEKLLSYRSSGYENPDEPKEVKYEESDPAIDDVLTKLADESDMVNGHDEVELNGHGDSAPNGHHIINGSGWPEGTTMHLPPPAKGAAVRGEAKFKLSGPIHVDLVSVPHRGKTILLNDEAASLEFFSSVRSSIYLLQSGGEVPVHVLEGWKKGKGAWAANVPSRLVPTHHNEVVAKWAHENQDELAEVGLTVATSVDLTTLTYPDGQAKACTLIL